MKTVILAGGLGTRMREETEYRPKPMVEVGGKPILWHIMNSYASYDQKDFVVCTGYKGEMIKDYFLNFHARNSDVTIELGEPDGVTYHDSHEVNDWAVTVAFTGDSTLTGGRIVKASKYFPGERFLCTYGDGLSDVNIADVIKFHESHGKLATLTAVRPQTRFGVLDIDKDSEVLRFSEKPPSTGWINAGFFVFEPEVLDYITEDCMLEQAPLRNLAADGELMAYKHDGFFQPMDTVREASLLNDLWASGSAPWARGKGPGTR